MHHRMFAAAAAHLALALAACATTPLTPSQCAQKEAEAATAQRGLPALQAAVGTALAASGLDANAKAVKDAQAAFDAGQALIAADQLYLAANCPAAPATPPA